MLDKEKFIYKLERKSLNNGLKNVMNLNDSLIFVLIVNNNSKTQNDQIITAKYEGMHQ